MPPTLRTIYLFFILANLSLAVGFSATLRLGWEGRQENDLSKTFRLIPQPQKIELLEGQGLVDNSLAGIYLQGTAKNPCWLIP